MVVKKRERLELIYDILISIKKNGNRVGPTRLLYSSNLSSKMFREYILELLEKEFILEEIENNGKKIYSVMKNGEEYLQKYKEIKSFIDNFGL